jgi:hypothetical protein
LLRYEVDRSQNKNAHITICTLYPTRGTAVPDWSSRYPLIVEAARRIPIKQFVIDGEAVLLGMDGISDFDGLYSG